MKFSFVHFYTCLFAVAASFSLSAEPTQVGCPPQPTHGRVNEVMEFCFEGLKNWDDEAPECGSGPYDYDVNRVDALITDAVSTEVVTWSVTGFWDGGNIWKVRFVPPKSTVYYFCLSSTDGRLNGQCHWFDALPQQNTTNPFRKNGPFLKVVDQKVVRSDGSPMFVLADKWATFPSLFYPSDTSLGVAEQFPRSLLHSNNLPSYSPEGEDHDAFDNETVDALPFEEFLNKRTQQGFNFIGAHGLHRRVVFQNTKPDGSVEYKTITGLAAFSPKAELGLKYWRLLDHFLQKAEAKGVVITLGIQSYSYFDKPTLCVAPGQTPSEDHVKRVHRAYFRHLLARYGAYPTTFWFTQEFNQLVSSDLVVEVPPTVEQPAGQRLCSDPNTMPAPLNGPFCFVDPGTGGVSDKTTCIEPHAAFRKRCWFKPEVYSKRLRLIWDLMSMIKQEDAFDRAILIHEASRLQSSMRIIENGTPGAMYAPARVAHAPVDIVATQQGHRMLPWRQHSGMPTVKARLETEFNWEGGQTRRNNLAFTITNTSRRPSALAEDEVCRTNNAACVVVDADTVMSSFLQSLFSGDTGFGYGAFGLFNGIVDIYHPETTGNWGPLVSAREAIEFEGANRVAAFKRGFMGETDRFGNSQTRTLRHSQQAWSKLRNGHAVVEEQLAPSSPHWKSVSGGKVRVLSTVLDSSDSRFVALYFEQGDAGTYRVKTGRRQRRRPFRVVGIDPRNFAAFTPTTTELLACPDEGGYVSLPSLPASPAGSDWLVFIENARPSSPPCPH
jgi:hypothetical protein